MSEFTVIETKTKPRYLVIYKDGHEEELEFGITKIENEAYKNTDIVSISLPSSVTEIGESAFEYCDSLTDITIPNSVTHIGDYAFKSCKSLTNISIPDSIIYIGADAFAYCDNLEYNEYENCKYLGNAKNPYCILIGVTNENQSTYTIHNNTKILDKSFCNCKKLTSITIPDNVVSIGCMAFGYCNSLSSINIPNSVTSIGSFAFSCTNLTSITIPNNVTSIGFGAFSPCNSLKSIAILSSVTSISDHAFAWCKKLSSITIPNSVTSIGNKAFFKCNSLKNIYYEGPESDWAKIKIEAEGNEKLVCGTFKRAKIHFNSK